MTRKVIDLPFALLILCLFFAACAPEATLTPESTLSSVAEQPTEAPRVVDPTPTPKPALAATPTQQAYVIAQEDQFAYQQAARLGRGVNLGNALEAPREGEWGVTLKEEYFDLIRDAGFDSVRVPIRWNAYALEESPFTISPDIFARVDWVIEQATARELAVVINIHHYEEIMATPRPEKERFLAIWEQIAKHYQSAPDTVFFEILNEPNGSLSTLYWVEYANEAIQVIRKTNPDRSIVVGPGNWNSLWNLWELSLPETDRNLIVTFHYYDPFQFTHQGAEWVDNSDPWLGTQWVEDEESLAKIRADFKVAYDWSLVNRRPIYLGEFGAYSKADLESRHLWTRSVARIAEEYGFAWAYWEFCAGFGVYDPNNERWNDPILTALIQ